MPYRSVLIMFLLAASTVAGITLALMGQGGWRTAVFWYSAQLLPLLYIALAWAGSKTTDDGDSTAHTKDE
jgi:hypothetical protein